MLIRVHPFRSDPTRRIYFHGPQAGMYHPNSDGFISEIRLFDAPIRVVENPITSDALLSCWEITALCLKALGADGRLIERLTHPDTPPGELGNSGLLSKNVYPKMGVFGSRAGEWAIGEAFRTGIFVPDPEEPPRLPALPKQLYDRFFAIAPHLAEGKSNMGVADALPGISVNTVIRSLSILHQEFGITTSMMVTVAGADGRLAAVSPQ